MSWTTGGPCPRPFRAALDGQEFVALDYKQIFTLYRVWKTKDGGRLDANWEEQVWLAMKANHPKFFKKTPKKASPGVSVASAAAFVGFVAKRMIGRKNEVVDPSVAKARAKVCFDCPMKEPVLGCAICKDALKMVVEAPEKVDAPQGCGACGCWLPLKIWVPRKELGSSDAYPFWERCWMRGED